MAQQTAIGEVRESLARDRAVLRDAVERVPAALRGQKPAPDRWSVAEVLEHLSIVEGRVVALLAAMIPTAPETSSAGSATALDRARLRNRSLRIDAPGAIHPTGTISAEAAWSRLEESRAKLLQVLGTAEGRDLSQIGRDHPALGKIDGYQWIAAVGGHEERHALQIVEIAEALGATG